MSSNILYHGFGIQGYRYKRSRFQQGAIVFSIEKDPFSLRCPCCNTWDVSRCGEVLRAGFTLCRSVANRYILLCISLVFNAGIVGLSGKLRSN